MQHGQTIQTITKCAQRKQKSHSQRLLWENQPFLGSTQQIKHPETTPAKKTQPANCKNRLRQNRNSRNQLSLKRHILEHKPTPVEKSNWGLTSNPGKEHAIINLGPITTYQNRPPQGTLPLGNLRILGLFEPTQKKKIHPKPTIYPGKLHTQP